MSGSSSTTERVNDPSVGDTLNIYGEKFTWTTGHMIRKELYTMLHTYDVLGGQAYDRAKEIFNEQQELASKEAKASEKPPQPKAKPDIFQIVKDNAATDPACGALWNEVNKIPDWVDWKQIERGQKIFFRYGVAQLMSLGYQSLYVGMAASRIVEVLLRTGAFSQAAAKTRSFETAQWVLEIMRDVQSMKPGGDGWESTVRVRLLHSAVRSRLRDMAAAKPEYFNQEEWGIPINDLDQVATICSFSAAPIYSGMPRQKIKMREQEIVDYFALWRFFAWLLGTPDKYFATPETAKKVQESIIYYEIHPNENSRVLADNLIKSFVGSPPFYPPAGLINAAARCLAGPQLAKELGVPEVNLFWRGMWSSSTSMVKWYTYICRSNKVLDKGNIKMMKKVTWKVVVQGKHGLKGTKTKFPLKYQPHYGLTKAEP